jgi:HlyD family secretion protein
LRFSFGRFVAVIVALAATGVVVYAFLPKPVEIDVARVERGPLVVTVDHEGRTRIKERYMVSAPLGGRLMRVDLHPGDAVEVGSTVIAAIEPSDPEMLDVRTRAQAEARVKAAEAAKERAAASLEQARSTDEVARAELERSTRLFERHAVSQQDYDTVSLRHRIATEALRSAQFGVRIAEFELEQAQAALLGAQPHSAENLVNGRFEIRSPINGCVLRVLQESSAVVTPGTALLELGDPADLEIEIDVLSSDAVKIAPGARVWVEHWGGERLQARVRLVEPAAFTKISALGVEEQRVWVIADFDDAPDTRPKLGDAYRVEARIVIWETDNTIKVPAGSLFRYNNEWAVFLVSRARARLRVVQIGHNNGLEAEVLEGLSQGDEVIVHPTDRIRPKVRVKPRQPIPIAPRATGD